MGTLIVPEGETVCRKNRRRGLERARRAVHPLLENVVVGPQAHLAENEGSA